MYFHLTIQEKVINIGSVLNGRVSEACNISTLRLQFIQFFLFKLKKWEHNVPVLSVINKARERSAKGS